jgi:tRNA pseudouridine55 synthase
MNRATALNGLLVIDKPVRMTSRDALNRAWRWLPRGTRIGHTGTLDPLATGVLVMCVGAATRLAEYIQRMEKVYRAGLRLGERSTTDDGEGTLVAQPVTVPPSKDDVTAALGEFLGTINQVPPDHSAAKIAGRRAYALARQGREVSLAPRPVMIYAISLLDYDYPRLDLEVRCGKGTYIRSLARDLGERLGCGAYLESLRRTRVGYFQAHDALGLDADRDAALNRLLPLTEAVRDLRMLVLAEDQVARLRTGQGVPLVPGLEEGEDIAIVSPAGTLLAVGRAALAQGLILPTRVFAQAP